MLPHRKDWNFLGVGGSATGFVRVLENLESPGILLWHFPGLESPGKRPLVLESSGNLLNLAKKYEVYGRQ